MNWTEERTMQLEALWGEGLSASQIAKKIGGVTRNAVIGKVHRLGLPGRARDTQAGSEKTPVGTHAVRLAQKEETPVTLREGTPKTERRPSSARVRDAVSTIPECREEADKRKSILELTERTCKWPVGDPGGEEFYFCGCASPVGLPYCEWHARIAYQPVCERRRERRSA